MINDLGIIVAAAGSGERYGLKNKLLERLNGIPIFIHCLKCFIALCPPRQLILVVPRDEQQTFATAIAQFLPKAEIIMVEGGACRSQSIANGLRQLPLTVEYVAIHDAARPFATVELLEQCLATARQYGGAIPAKPVTDTLKRVDENNQIIANICRNNLWRVETPQVFDVQKLRQAHQLVAIKGTEYTDDAAVMEVADFQVRIVKAPAINLKITYPEDIAIAEMLLAHQPKAK